MAATNPDIIERLTAIGIVLFILSLITERITLLIRKEWGHFRNTFSIIFKGRKSKKPQKSALNSLKDDPEREREAMLLSFIIGTIVAIISNANIFSLFPAADITTILFVPFKFESEWNLILIIIGFILTGLFLSLGSRFFHDLLDTLLQVKNLKRKLNDEKTYKIESVKELEEYLELTEADIVRKAINDDKGLILAMPNVSGMGIGYIEVNGKQKRCATVHVKDDNIENIKNFLNVNLPVGRPERIPVKIVPNVGEVKLHSTISPGIGVGNANNNQTGTLGCILFNISDGKNYLLTCYHVLNAGHNWNFFQNIGKETVVKRNSSEKIGKLIYGRRDDYFDIAVIELFENVDLRKEIEGIGVLDGYRKVGDKDHLFRTDVIFKGATSDHPKNGKIVNTDFELSDIPYPDGKKTIHEIFVLSKFVNGERRAPSEPGDSGALIVDENRKALGIVIGGDNMYSYAIPITSIINHLQLQLP